jgi:hypothetical protein
MALSLSRRVREERDGRKERRQRKGVFRPPKLGWTRAVRWEKERGSWAAGGRKEEGQREGRLVRVQIQNRTKPILFSSMKISESILFCFVVLVLGLCFRRKGKGVYIETI